MDQGSNTHQKRTRQAHEPRRGVIQLAYYYDKLFVVVKSSDKQLFQKGSSGCRKVNKSVNKFDELLLFKSNKFTVTELVGFSRCCIIINIIIIITILVLVVIIISICVS